MILCVASEYGDSVGAKVTEDITFYVVLILQVLATEEQRVTRIKSKPEVCLTSAQKPFAPAICGYF